MNLTDSDFIRSLSHRDAHRLIERIANALEVCPTTPVATIIAGFRDYLAKNG